MKKITLLLFIQFIFCQYALDDYEFIWNYNNIGNASIKVSKTSLSTSLMICDNKTGQYAYSSCMKILPEDALILSAVLSKTNSYYDTFKDEINDIKEEIDFNYRSAKGTLTFSKTLNDGFRVKLFNDATWTSIYFDKKEANYIAEHLKDSKKIINYINRIVKF